MPQSDLQHDISKNSLNVSVERLEDIQRIQQEAINQKNEELTKLRHQLERQQHTISEKDSEIRRLERERYRAQEERALELRQLYRRSAAGGHHPANPYHDHDSSLCDTVGRKFLGGRSSLRGRDAVNWAILILFGCYIYFFAASPPDLQEPFYRPETNFGTPYRAEENFGTSFQPEQPKPWESKAPTPIALMDTKDSSTLRRHKCLKAVRDRQKDIFTEILGLSENSRAAPLLVDPAYHANVGDHMLTLGELQLIEGSLKLPPPQQCHYIQAAGYYTVCTEVIMESDPNNDRKVALWHAGGNWGDLWRDAQDVRIPSFRTILKNGYKLVGLPQSLFYQDEELKARDVIEIKKMIALGLDLAVVEEDAHRRLNDELFNDFGNDFQEVDADRDGFEDEESWDFNHERDVIKAVNTSKLDTEEGRALAHSKVIFTWREKESLEEATRLYPFVRNMLVPDMAFQLGPYAPILSDETKQVDILLFLRNDHESKVQSQRYEDTIRRMLPEKVTFRVVDWPDRLDIFESHDKFFTDTSVQLLSLGKVVVCDRLHAALLAYLTGLPFIYIDQVSGKITKTLSGAFEGMPECLDGSQMKWQHARSLEEGLQKATDMIEVLSREKKNFIQRLFGS